VVYKVRVRNRDARRGTRGGYRVIYYVRKRDHVVLLTIYSKADQGDIDPASIARIIDQAD
jgi:mRNA-degrading endonuclease RelE of RelBE toxin-antitoxin system